MANNQCKLFEPQEVSLVTMKISLSVIAIEMALNQSLVMYTLCSPDHFTLGWFTCFYEYD